MSDAILAVLTRIADALDRIADKLEFSVIETLEFGDEDE